MTAAKLGEKFFVLKIYIYCQKINTNCGKMLKITNSKIAEKKNYYLALKDRNCIPFMNVKFAMKHEETVKLIKNLSGQNLFLFINVKN